MKSKFIFATALIFLSIVAFWSIVKNTVNGKIVGSALLQQKSTQATPAPTPLPTPNAPKTFTFNSSTDLASELEKVNPQVLDSDFE
jgi:hypothetical protein